MKDTQTELPRPSATPGELSEADWASATPAVRHLIVALLERIVALETQVSALEEKLRCNSTNSSKPPSSDGPSTGKGRDKHRAQGGKRKRGGQPGHKGKSRKLLSVDEVDHVERLRPKACPCGGVLCIDEARPERHQVWELPAVVPSVTEYQVFAGRCAGCGEWSHAELPVQARGGILGPRTMAVIATLTGKFRLSKRSVEALLQDLFGLDVSVGTISNTEARVSQALSGAYDEARAAVSEQRVVHMDETGWRENNKRAWLWTAVSTVAIVFVLRVSRGAAVAKEVLSETFAHVLVTDRWSAYNWVPTAQRQVCWAHLIRDFTKIAERGDESEMLGEALLAQGKDVFRLWRRFVRNEISRTELQCQMAPIRSGLKVILQAGTEVTQSKTKGTCAEILKLEAAMWTFIHVEGVEPTNNIAERSIRPAVIWRKTSFGTDQERGSRYVERVLTVVSTCQQQGRNALEYIRSAIVAHYSGQQCPSLIHVSKPADRIAA